MSTKFKSSDATSLHAVQQAFEHWRRSRTQRGVTPIALRLQAVSLMKHHRRAHICKALRLNDQVLKQWALDSEATHYAPPDRPERCEVSADCGFIELPAYEAHSRDDAERIPMTTVRIELPSGAVMSTEQSFTLEQILSAARAPLGAGV